jgi:PKD repeat protein
MEWIRNAKLGCMYENTLCGNTLADLRIWQASGGATIVGACNVYDTETIKANATGPGADWPCGDQPTAGFSSSESVPGTIEFTDSSISGNLGDPIDSWYWDFGDCSDPGTSMYAFQ